MLKKVAVLACAIAGATIASQSASAATATDNLAVSASITGTCTLSAANALAFGNVPSTSSATNLSVNLDVNCSAGVDYLIGMDLGQNSLAGVRRMSSGSAFLSYEVFVDSARTQPYTALGGAGNFSPTPPLTGGAVNIPIYGQILSQSTPPTGTYTDSVTVTIQY